MKRREIIKKLRELGYTRREIFAYNVLRFFVTDDDIELHNILISLSMVDIRQSLYDLNKVCELYTDGGL